MIVWGLCNDYDIFIRADSDDRFPQIDSKL